MYKSETVGTRLEHKLVYSASRYTARPAGLALCAHITHGRVAVGLLFERKGGLNGFSCFSKIRLVPNRNLLRRSLSTPGFRTPSSSTVALTDAASIRTCSPGHTLTPRRAKVGQNLNPSGWEAEEMGGPRTGSLCAVASFIPGTLRNYATGRFTKYPWVQLTPTTGVAFQFNRKEREEAACPPAGQTEQHALPAPPGSRERKHAINNIKEQQPYRQYICLRMPLQAPPRPHHSCRGVMWPKSAVAIAACACSQSLMF